MGKSRKHLLAESRSMLTEVLANKRTDVKWFEELHSATWDLYKRHAEMHRPNPFTRANGEVVCTSAAYRVFKEAQDRGLKARIMLWKCKTFEDSPYLYHVMPVVELPDKSKAVFESGLVSLNGDHIGTHRIVRTPNQWVTLKHDLELAVQDALWVSSNDVDIEWYQNMWGSRPVIEFMRFCSDSEIESYKDDWLMQLRIILKEFHDGVAFDQVGEDELKRRDLI